MTTTCLGPSVKDCAERFCWYHGPVLRKVGESYRYRYIFRAKDRTRKEFRMSDARHGLPIARRTQYRVQIGPRSWVVVSDRADFIRQLQHCAQDGIEVLSVKVPSEWLA